MQQKIAVCALIKKGDTYLFIKQDKPGGAYQGTLHLPGGSLELGEGLYDGIRREVREETNIEIQDVQPVDFDTDTLPYKGEETQWIFLRFSAIYASGEPKAGDDAKELLWIATQDIGNYLHNEPSKRLLRKVGLL